MDDQDLLLLVRVKRSDNGPELIDLLKRMSLKNYQRFKAATSEANDVFKGYAIAIDEVVGLLEGCDDRLRERGKNPLG